MARQQVGYNPGVVAPQTTASPNVQTVQVARNFDAGYQAKKLAEALGYTSDVVQQYDQQDKEKRLQEQKNKLGYYVEQFRKDYHGGAVSEAQVGQRFPETVPVIRAKIAEVLGSQEADKQAKDIVSEIMNNAELRTNTDARRQFIEQRKQEAMKHTVGAINNDFYVSGFSSGIDKVLNQYEAQFVQETAQYHQKVQQEGFSKAISDALLSGGDLEAVDDAYKLSSIDNLTRKKLAVETITQEAFARDKPELLDRIPSRYLNADLKKNVEDARIQIAAIRMTNFRNAQYISEVNKAKRIEDGQLQILDRVAQGLPINPLEYRNVPELFQYANSVMNQPRIDPGKSAARESALRSLIMDSSTVGNKSEEQWRQEIITDPNLNPSNKVALINDVSTLVKGRDVMKDISVSTAINSYLEPRLKILSNSPITRILNLSGDDPGLMIKRSYEESIKARFLEHYRANNAWPIGSDKERIINEEVGKAEKMFKDMTDIRHLQDIINASQQPAGSSTQGGNTSSEVKGLVDKYYGN